MTEKTAKYCEKCSGKMKYGIALDNTLSGIPDFIGNTEICTVSRTGKAVLVLVRKCERCGRSVTA